MQKFTAVAYARYSSDKQQESSITVQLAEIKKFCVAHGIELIREYIDEAQTGTNSNRKRFQDMIADAPLREFQLVIVHRMDRWARNVDDARYYKKYLNKYGVKVISAIEEFDETPEGEFFELLSMGMAELYSKKLAREAVAGKIANAREGKAHGGIPLLGYKVKNKYYVIEETEAEAVRIIFDLTAKGYGYTYIRDYLNDNGYRHADGRLFTLHFYDILRNRKYIGEYVYNRAVSKNEFGKRNRHKDKTEKEIIRIVGGMPRIIDDDTFYKVQAILDARKSNSRVLTTKENRKFLLSGLLRCSECGGAVCGSNYCSHQVYYTVYKCNSRGKSCSTQKIITDYLEDYVHSLLYKCLLSNDNINNLCELVRLCYIKAYNALQEKRAVLVAEHREGEAKIQSMAKDLMLDSSKHLQQYISERIDGVVLDNKKLQLNIDLVDNELSSFPDYNPTIIKRNAKILANKLKNRDFKQLQAMFRQLIKSIHISKNTVETTINLQPLLDTYQPLQITIIEHRDNIARHENFGKQALNFSELTVRL